jgi:hypothetical protein
MVIDGQAGARPLPPGKQRDDAKPGASNRRAGLSTRSAEAAGVSEGAVRQWMKRAREAGHAAAVWRAIWAPARTARARTRGRGLPRTTLDPWPDRRRDSSDVWRLLSSASCRSLASGHALEPTTARTAGSPARRSGHRPLALRGLAGDQNGAQAQQQSIFFTDESSESMPFGLECGRHLAASLRICRAALARESR